MKQRTPRGRAEDRERIATDQEYEMRYMREKYHVTNEQIKNAIATVGNNRQRVEEYLKERRSDHINQPGNEDRAGKDDLQNLEVHEDPNVITKNEDRLSGLSELQKKEQEGQVEKENAEDVDQ
jgi:hypothetical protein